MDSPLTTRSLILHALEAGSGHCQALTERVQNAMGIRPWDGSMYPALKEMEKAGLIMGLAEAPPEGRGGRVRRVYVLTPAGVLRACNERIAIRELFALRRGPAGPAAEEAVTRG